MVTSVVMFKTMRHSGLGQVGGRGKHEYANGHSGFETPKRPVGYSSKFNSKVSSPMKLPNTPTSDWNEFLFWAHFVF